MLLCFLLLCCYYVHLFQNLTSDSPRCYGNDDLSQSCPNGELQNPQGKVVDINTVSTNFKFSFFFFTEIRASNMNVRSLCPHQKSIATLSCECLGITVLSLLLEG